MSINEPAPTATRVGELLKTYYDGLTSMFAGGAGKDISGTPARVDVTEIADGKFEAKMHLIDAFATFEPIDVRVLVESVAQTGATSLVCIRLSPQPASHAIWRSLDAAIVDLRAHVGTPRDAKASEPAKHTNNAMSPFARLIGGEWQLTSPELRGSLFNTWHWGPGRHSVRRVTDGIGADGKPWRATSVHFWHPGRKEIRLLGFSPFDRQVSEGSITFSADGESAEGVFDLHHPTHLRKMGLRWTFLEPDRYHDVLLEATGPEGLKPMNAWDHVRAAVPNPPRQMGVPGAAPSAQIEPLMPIVGTWEAEIPGPDGKPRRTRSTVQWQPLSDVVYVRVVAPSGAGSAEGDHVFDAYVYFHPGARTLRWLALSEDGRVFEGDVAAQAQSNGTVQVDLSDILRDTEAWYAVRLDLNPPGELRQRISSVSGGGSVHRVLHDIRHTKVQARGE